MDDCLGLSKKTANQKHVAEEPLSDMAPNKGCSL